jgi:hypothetical protein
MAQATLAAAARFPAAAAALLRTRRSPAVAPAPLCTQGLRHCRRAVAMAAAPSSAPLPAADPPPKVRTLAKLQVFASDLIVRERQGMLLHIRALGRECGHVLVLYYYTI